MNVTNKKIMVYPFSYQNSGVVRQMLYEKRYMITSVVTLSRWCPTNVDASYFDSLNDMGIYLSSDYESELNNVDAVFWLEGKKTQDPRIYNKIKQNICLALCSGKSVVCCKELSAYEHKMFLDIAKSNGVAFEYNASTDYHDSITISGNTIEVPIVAIVGMTQQCSVADVSYYLANSFAEEGYNICHICPFNNYGLTEGEPFPDFMFQADYSNAEKAEFFYNYLVNKQRLNHPDLFIVSIPTALLPVNDKIRSDYGILHYLCLNAIKPDYVIVNLECKKYPPEIGHLLNELLKYRFDSRLGALVMSNNAINSESLVHAKTEFDIDYNVYTMEFMHSTCSKARENIKDYPVVCCDDIDLIRKDIVAKLSNN